MSGPVELSRIGARQGLWALSPVAVFLCMYLAVSLIIGDFYKMPLSVALLTASMWSVVIYRNGGSLAERIETFSRSAGHPNILYMIWIFILAGAFASLAKEIGAIDATSQGCKMADKFKANLWIALPAALATLMVYIFMSIGAPDVPISDDANPWLVLPYLVVIVAAVCGVNVSIVLTLGILTAVGMGLLYGSDMISIFGYMGKGIDSMGDLIIVTLLAAGMLGVIKAAGGIQYLLRVLTAKVSGLRGAQVCVAFLVGIVNMCTANNTVAIITVGGIAREIGEKYGIDPRKNASLLDSCSCIVQCLIPYGAQTLLAASLAGIAPAAPFSYLYYPWALAVMVALSIVFLFPRRLSRRVL